MGGRTAAWRKKRDFRYLCVFRTALSCLEELGDVSLKDDAKDIELKICDATGLDWNEYWDYWEFAFGGIKFEKDHNEFMQGWRREQKENSIGRYLDGDRFQLEKDK